MNPTDIANDSHPLSVSIVATPVRNVRMMTMKAQSAAR